MNSSKEHNAKGILDRFTNPGKIQLISTVNLHSGLPYQRPVRPGHVKQLIRKWDPTYLTPVEVSYRDGKYNVVNGQHRIEAMRKMNGGENLMVQCMVYTGMTYQQEAAMYYLLDKTSGHLKLANAIKALLESGTDPEITDIQQRIGRAGFTWALDKPAGIAYEIKPVREIINAYQKLGGHSFSRMLGLMAGAWHGTQNSLKSGMISGMALFLKTHETELEDYEFIRRLSQVNPAEIIQLAQVDRPAMRYARLIRKKYNEQGAKMLPDRFRK
jgi:hypothetical protein